MDGTRFLSGWCGHRFVENAQLLADRGPAGQPDRLRPEPAQSQHRHLTSWQNRNARDRARLRHLPRHLRTPEMRQVFSDEAAHRLLPRDRGGAGARARQARDHPRNAMHEIAGKCRIENIDLARLKQQTERIGYPILGVVQQIVGLCEDGLGEWCHWGATTQDITDTAAILQIRAALDLVEKDMEAIAGVARRPVAPLSRHADGRPQQPAAGGAAHLRLQDGRPARRHAAPPRAARAMRPRVLVGEFGGAVGNLASLGARGLEVQAALMPGARPRSAGDRLAYGARPHRRGRLLPRPPHRHARQDLHGRKAPDADRGRRGL